MILLFRTVQWVKSCHWLTVTWQHNSEPPLQYLSGDAFKNNVEVKCSQHQFSRNNPGHSVPRRPEPVSVSAAQLTPPLSNGSDSHYSQVRELLELVESILFNVRFPPRRQMISLWAPHPHLQRHRSVITEVVVFKFHYWLHNTVRKIETSWL